MVTKGGPSDEKGLAVVDPNSESRSFPSMRPFFSPFGPQCCQIISLCPVFPHWFRFAPQFLRLSENDTFLYLLFSVFFYLFLQWFMYRYFLPSEEKFYKKIFPHILLHSVGFYITKSEYFESRLDIGSNALNQIKLMGWLDHMSLCAIIADLNVSNS